MSAAAILPWLLLAGAGGGLPQVAERAAHPRHRSRRPPPPPSMLSSPIRTNLSGRILSESVRISDARIVPDKYMKGERARRAAEARLERQRISVAEEERRRKQRADAARASREAKASLLRHKKKQRLR